VVRFRFRNIGKNLLLTFFLAPALVVSTTHAAETEPAAAPPQERLEPIGIAANPGAVNATNGTGELEKYVLDLVGIKDDHGVRIGGLWIGNTNWLMSGGAEPGEVSWNSLFIADLLVDMEKLTGWWKGALFGAEFLRFDGQQTNEQAGSIQGYNGLPGAEPLDRSELYQLWIRQEFFDEKLIVRLGKSLPSADFGNVLRPVPLAEQNLFIPAVSGLLYTPVFKNPTLFGTMPSYYNSACGVTLTFAPVKWWYLNYGFYDGNLATGVQTGTTGPHFNGYYFTIAETGFSWRLGKNHLPGKIGAGFWDQTGQLNGPNGISENGTSGFYLFGSQRLWYRHPDEDSSGISVFFQFGTNDSETRPVNHYFGTGLTAFGLVPSRPKDSMGCGISWAWLNPNIFQRTSELMFQGYYQAHLVAHTYLEPAISYIPTPGASSDLDSAWATTVQVTVLF
jgi:porin